MSSPPCDRLSGMSRVTCHMSMSLDGFVAGPDQSEANPIGIGGMQLHEWHFEPLHEADVPVRPPLLARRGPYVRGRNMCGPFRRDGVDGGRGGGGDAPPYHAPV